MTSATGRNFYGINNLQQKTVFVLIPFPHFWWFQKRFSSCKSRTFNWRKPDINFFFSEAAISASNSEHQGVSNLRPVQTRCSSLHLIQWLQQRRDRKILISLQKCNRLSMTAADLRFSVKKPLSDSRPLWMQSFVLLSK